MSSDDKTKSSCLKNYRCDYDNQSDADAVNKDFPPSLKL